MNQRQEEQGRYADFLLIGGGLASATAAETLRQEGAEGSIVLLTAEPQLPYHRPPLSTRVLLDPVIPPTPLVLPERYYAEHGIDCLLGTIATAVDTGAQLLHTDKAGPIRYGQLLIATGARPLHLQVAGAQLDGIHYLRTYDDALAIRQAASFAQEAVVVGGGFVALELAAALVQLGLRVTLLAKHRVLFDKLEEPAIGAYLCELYASHHVEIVCCDTVAEFLGRERVEAVLTEAGRTLPCQIVALGLGVTPELGFLAGSGIELDDGVRVDQYLRTNVPNVYAAGDVANYFDPVFDLRRRGEHWDNAVRQGRLAARNMLQQRLRYDEVSYFACQLFDFGFQVLGMGHDAHERAWIGSLPERSCALLYLKNDIPRALFSTGRPAGETRAIESLIRYRTKLECIRSQLDKPGFSLTRVPSQTAFILQGGGALGAFECGVVRALEEQEVFADIVAGVSIGAFNGAIIAANPRHASKALEAFWRRISVLAPELPDERLRRMLASWQTLSFGVPEFFRPRWGLPDLLTGGALAWTSLYDPSPVKALLSEFVDFDALASSPVRLLVSAVDVETARLTIFDSYVDTLSADHILASGSLPPGFPWTTIDGKHYWDGGIMSNSPLEMVIERCGGARKRIFIVDLFPNKKPLPTNLMEVMGRRDEIVYTERIRRDSAEQAVLGDFRKLVEDILADVSPAQAALIRQWPRYTQLMGDDDAKLDILRITREGAEGEPTSKDYDFSSVSIRRHIEAGYATAQEALRGRARWSCMHPVQTARGVLGVSPR